MPDESLVLSVRRTLGELEDRRVLVIGAGANRTMTSRTFSQPRPPAEGFIDVTLEGYYQLDDGEEGCLSLPGAFVPCARPDVATVHGTGLDGQASEAPFEHAVLEAPGCAAVCAEDVQGVVGHDAVGATAVGDDLAVAGQLGQPRLELVQRYGHGAGEVAGPVLLHGPDVEHGDLSGGGTDSEEQDLRSRVEAALLARFGRG